MRFEIQQLRFVIKHICTQKQSISIRIHDSFPLLLGELCYIYWFAQFWRKILGIG